MTIETHCKCESIPIQSPSVSLSRFAFSTFTHISAAEFSIAFLTGGDLTMRSPLPPLGLLLGLNVIPLAWAVVLVNDQFEACVQGGTTITCADSVWTGTDATRVDVVEIELAGGTSLTDVLRVRQTDALVMQMDTTGFEDIQVSYRSAHRNLDNGETCQLAFNAGSGFVPARTYLPAPCNGNTECPSMTNFVDPLPVAAADVATLQLRFSTDASSAFEYCLFDNLVVTGEVIITAAPTTATPTTDAPSFSPSTPDPTRSPTTLSPTLAPTTTTGSPSFSPSTSNPTSAPSTSEPTTPTTLSPTFAPTIDDTTRPSAAPTLRPVDKEEPESLLVPAIAAVACGSAAFAAILLIHRRATRPSDRRSEESTGTRALGTQGFEYVPEASIEPEALGLESMESGGAKRKIPNAEVVSAILAPSGSRRSRQAGRAAEFGEYIPKRKRKLLKAVEEELAVPTTSNPLYGKEENEEESGEKEKEKEKEAEKMLDTEDEEEEEKQEEVAKDKEEEVGEEETDSEGVKEEEAKEEEGEAVKKEQEDAKEDSEKGEAGESTKEEVKDKDGEAVDNDDDKESFF